MIINAFGYTHDMGEGFNEEEMDILLNAPVVYILSGERAADFVDYSLRVDQTAFWTDAGECLVFCYEELENDQYDLLVMLDAVYEIEERGQKLVSFIR